MEAPLTQSYYYAAIILSFSMPYIFFLIWLDHCVPMLFCICPTAKDSKTDWKFCQFSEWVHKDSAYQYNLKQYVTIARNNHNTDKFHSPFCSKLYFIVLKNFRRFILYIAWEMKNSNKINFWSLSPINSKKYIKKIIKKYRYIMYSVQQKLDILLLHNPRVKME